jgi:hypothetical protein
MSRKIALASVLLGTYLMGCGKLPSQASNGPVLVQGHDNSATLVQDYTLAPTNLMTTDSATLDMKLNGTIRQENGRDGEANIGQFSNDSSFPGGKTVTATRGDASAEFSNQANIQQNSGHEGDASNGQTHISNFPVTVTAPQGNASRAWENDSRVEQVSGATSSAFLSQSDFLNQGGSVTAKGRATDRNTSQATLRQTSGSDNVADIRQQGQRGGLEIVQGDTVQVDFSQEANVTQRESPTRRADN